MISRNRTDNSNFRTHMARIIRRAGLTPWVKTFQNLRASRQTELAQRFPIHVVCEWIGNSRPVALEHYLNTTAGDFERATSQPTAPIATPGVQPVAEAKQNPKHSGVTGGVTASESKVGASPDSDQNSEELCVIGLYETPSQVAENPLETYLVPPAGFEPATYSLGNCRSIP